MKAVNYSEGRVNVIDTPKPTGEGILVNISSCGICGTDMDMLNNKGHFSHIAGHEMSGRLTDGTLVAIEPLDYCGGCSECKSGNYNLCSNEKFQMIGLTSNGGMAEQIIVPEHCLVKLDQEIDPTTSCLIEPIAVAVHAGAPDAAAVCERRPRQSVDLPPRREPICGGHCAARSGATRRDRRRRAHR